MAMLAADLRVRMLDTARITCYPHAKRNEREGCDAEQHGRLLAQQMRHACRRDARNTGERDARAAEDQSDAAQRRGQITPPAGGKRPRRDHRARHDQDRKELPAHRLRSRTCHRVTPPTSAITIRAATASVA
jgi:hypothetical protein